MSDYTKSTNFATKDTLSPGSALKIVRGTEIDTEFNAISTAIATKADTAAPTFTTSIATPIVKSASTLKLQSNGTTDAVIIDTAQNVGLGVTPSSWGSGYKAFEFGNSSTQTGALFSNGINDTWLVSNAYFNGTNFIYKSTGYATGIEMVSGAYKWNTAASGTAGNAITFTQAMTLDASGNLGVGTTSPATKLHVSADGSSDPLRLQSTKTSYERSWTIGPNVGADGLFAIRDSTAGANRLNIDTSGNLLVGKTTTAYGTQGTVIGNGNISVSKSSETFSSYSNVNNSHTVFYRFDDATYMGGIFNQSSLGVSYTTASDYRLKNTVAPITGALAKVAALKPVTYKWNADGSDGEGFIAHELAEVCPQAVVGEKDAVDANGNPKYQGIDTSFLVATLTAAIQELKAEFDAYKATHP